MEIKTQEFVRELMQALRLPEHCTSINLEPEPREILRVKCEYIPNIKAEPMRRALKLLTLAHFTEGGVHGAFDLDAEIDQARQRIHQLVDRHAYNEL